MRYQLVIGALALMLSSCAPMITPQETTAFLNGQFDGHPVDDFFVNYGVPASQYRLGNGGRIYRWMAAQPDVYYYPTYSPYYYPGSVYAYPNTFGAVPVTRYCELQIETDRYGIIRRILMTGDSTGRWMSSRCAEIFNYSPVS